MASVTLKNISKRWGSFEAVKRQSIDIADREFLVLLGPSGCGKTTTMRMIAGLEDPTEGEIYIGDKRVNDDLPKDRDIAMVFQNYGLYPHMTVGDNIGYPLRVRGIKGVERDAKISRAAERVELGALLARYPRELSGGQRQRVALARAIVRTPTVFLMDEPLSNLDAKLRVSMRAEIKRLQHDLKITTVYVTHDQIEAMTLAHRVAVMDHGVIQQIAAPEIIYDAPANLFVAGFIGSPAMNLIEGTLDCGAFKARDIEVAGAGVGSRARVVLGIRPEDSSVTASGRGDVAGSIYASELTGESVLVTADIGGKRIIAKADRAFRGDFGQSIGLSFDRRRLHLFDGETGLRVPQPIAN
jgi:multiple sugar transport system ATP-binding protein